LKKVEEWTTMLSIPFAIFEETILESKGLALTIDTIGIAASILSKHMEKKNSWVNIIREV
jgi:hypothetical protein